MNISTYIKNIGDKEFAILVGCKERTAAAWRRGERTPASPQIHKIVEATKGEISPAGCLNMETESTAA